MTSSKKLTPYTMVTRMFIGYIILISLVTSTSSLIFSDLYNYYSFGGISESFFKSDLNILMVQTAGYAFGDIRAMIPQSINTYEFIKEMPFIITRDDIDFFEELDGVEKVVPFGVHTIHFLRENGEVISTDALAFDITGNPEVFNSIFTLLDGSPPSSDKDMYILPTFMRMKEVGLGEEFYVFKRLNETRTWVRGSVISSFGIPVNIVIDSDVTDWLIKNLSNATLYNKLLYEDGILLGYDGVFLLIEDINKVPSIIDNILLQYNESIILSSFTIKTRLLGVYSDVLNSFYIGMIPTMILLLIVMLLTIYTWRKSIETILIQFLAFGIGKRHIGYISALITLIILVSSLSLTILSLNIKLLFLNNVIENVYLQNRRLGFMSGVTKHFLRSVEIIFQNPYPAIAFDIVLSISIFTILFTLFHQRLRAMMR